VVVRAPLQGKRCAVGGKAAAAVVGRAPTKGCGHRGWSVDSPIDWRRHRRRDRSRAVNRESVGGASTVRETRLSSLGSYRVRTVGREGKRIRPALAAVTAEASGGSVEHFTRAAKGRAVPVVAAALADADPDGAPVVSGVGTPLNRAVDVASSGRVGGRVVGAAVGREAE